MPTTAPWERLYSRRRFGVKLGLENELALLSAMGNPHTRYPIIHVAGTNGKGSTCALISSILSAAGLRVGLFTSPHLVRFNERYRIGDQDIADEALDALVSEIEGHEEAVQAQTGMPVTFFECSAAMAFSYFARQNVDVAVIEVGLGGRYDATNVVTPLVSVITRISMEHTEYLGDTLAAIAREKAGIVKPGVPVVCGANGEEALAVVRQVAADRASPLVDVTQTVSVTQRSASLDGQKVVVDSADASYGTLSLPLLGAHQLENLATAVAAIETFTGRLGVAMEPAIVKKGVASVAWRGRLTRIRDNPTVWVDGAHNSCGAQALGDALKQLAGKQPVGLVCGMCRDKDAAGFARRLGSRVTAAWAVPVDNDRTYTVLELRDALKAGGLAADACGSLREGVVAATKWARDANGVVCIAGSLFLAGEALTMDEEVN